MIRTDYLHKVCTWPELLLLSGFSFIVSSLIGLHPIYVDYEKLSFAKSVVLDEKENRKKQMAARNPGGLEVRKKTLAESCVIKAVLDSSAGSFGLNFTNHMPIYNRQLSCLKRDSHTLASKTSI